LARLARLERNYEHGYLSKHRYSQIRTELRREVKEEKRKMALRFQPTMPERTRKLIREANKERSNARAHRRAKAGCTHS
jgi:hypothetical protein